MRARTLGACPDAWRLPGRLALARTLGACPDAWRLPGRLALARTLGACPDAWRLPGRLALARNASRVHHLLIMIIAVGGIVRRIQTLPPLPPCLIK
jgi:hypothetical protein